MKYVFFLIKNDYICNMTLEMSVIIFLLFLSVFLMIVEFFFIPGTTIFGIVGFFCGIIGIYLAFKESSSFGYISIVITILLFIIFFIIGRRMMSKSKMNLVSEITSKVNTYNDGIINIGDIGITHTVLKPNGKAIIENKKLEVFSMGGYIEKDMEIEIIKIKKNKIIVKQIN